MGSFLWAAGDEVEASLIEAGFFGDGPHAPPVICEVLDDILGFFYRVVRA